MKTLPYEEFERIINELRLNHDRLDKIAEALNWAEAFDLSVCDEVVRLLQYIFKDEDGWLEYWVYERDFGRDWYEGCATESDGTDVNLSTTRKLYDFLIKNMQVE